MFVINQHITNISVCRSIKYGYTTDAFTQADTTPVRRLRRITAPTYRRSIDASAESSPIVSHDVKLLPTSTTDRRTQAFPPDLHDVLPSPSLARNFHQVVSPISGSLPTSQPATLCCARGRPIIVEWRDARHSAALSRSVTHRYVTERYTFQSDSQPQPNLRRCHVKTTLPRCTRALSTTGHRLPRHILRVPLCLQKHIRAPRRLTAVREIYAAEAHLKCSMRIRFSMLPALTAGVETIETITIA
ncbi:hypothetical protein EVAR_78114_1 [Eumeta japonica]|uniref:Uncharacterized protein n=1 Tax=Eumeta variegata TaxID=151549 RepID=A0A4C1T0D6_EUMVA|nr:hypothetical protein EVAR_78114_1 [Eumeta japonica]